MGRARAIMALARAAARASLSFVHEAAPEAPSSRPGWRPGIMLDDDLERATQILKAVAHPLRLRILSLLCAREECVGAMAARLGTKPTAVSQALAILRGGGLVAVTRRRGHARYRLEERALRGLIPRVTALAAHANGRRRPPP
jgi:ArsR family transcriptional regulator